VTLDKLQTIQAKTGDEDAESLCYDSPYTVYPSDNEYETR